jgi:hypothetical protein
MQTQIPIFNEKSSAKAVIVTPSSADITVFGVTLCKCFLEGYRF